MLRLGLVSQFGPTLDVSLRCARRRARAVCLSYDPPDLSFCPSPFVVLVERYLLALMLDRVVKLATKDAEAHRTASSREDIRTAFIALDPRRNEAVHHC